MREYGLYAKLEKCNFDCKQLEFLGYVVSSEGISMDLAKVQTMLDWQTPCSVRDVLCFLGFANFYRKFIKGYSAIILPLTQLTQMNHSFIWTPGAAKAFMDLKKAFIEADASDFSLGSILSQQGANGQLHPMAFHSRKFNVAEIN